MSATGLDAFDATNAEDEHLDQGRYAGGGWPTRAGPPRASRQLAVAWAASSAIPFKRKRLPCKN
jgi:hypothetical protein